MLIEDKDKDKFQESIQDFFDEGTVLIIGSGLSCAEGMPSMHLLSEKLKVEVPKQFRDDDKEIWKNIVKNLDSGKDLESCLLETTPNDNLEKIIKEITYNYIFEKDYDIYKKILKENYELKITTLIHKFNLDLYSLNIVTTNYDRLIEYSCEKSQIKVENMFEGKFFPKLNYKKFRENLNKKLVKEQKINLYKPHGCLNWKKMNNELIYSQYKDIGTPHIITPGTNKFKYGYETPFDINREYSNECIDNAKKIIFIGYGFNDSHLETRIKTPRNLKKPILILTKEFTKGINDLLPKATNIIAIEEKKNSNDSNVYWKGERMEINGNYWDVPELLKKVF
ncbi:MAG: SIR2 family protein [Fusobacteriaceae bacterium]